MGIREIAARLQEFEVLREEADFIRDMVLCDRGTSFRVVLPPNAVRLTLSIELSQPAQQGAKATTR